MVYVIDESNARTRARCLRLFGTGNGGKKNACQHNASKCYNRDIKVIVHANVSVQQRHKSKCQTYSYNRDIKVNTKTNQYNRDIKVYAKPYSYNRDIKSCHNRDVMLQTHVLMWHTDYIHACIHTYIRACIHTYVRDAILQTKPMY